MPWPTASAEAVEPVASAALPFMASAFAGDTSTVPVADTSWAVASV